MNDYLGTKDEVLSKLSVNSEIGMTTEQVNKSKLKYGTNTLTKEKQESLLKRVFHASTEPMILMLIAAGGIALFVNVFQVSRGGEADFLECIGIFGAILLSVIITVVMEGKSAKAFEELSKINENVQVKVMRNGNPLTLSKKDVVVGDILILGVGDKIPVDGRLIESSSLNVDESALTGESVPVVKNAECIICDEKTPVAERFNMLYAGTYITSGFGKLVATSVGDKTEFGIIARELSGDNRSTTPLQEKLNRLGKIITVFGVLAATIVFIAQLISFSNEGGLVLEEVINAFITSIILIVAAVPEGLPTILAVSLSINIIKLSKQNALVKKMIASETVGCVNVICSDKTGTLTENRMTVMGNIESEDILKNICINSTADIGIEGEFIGNPTECALLVSTKKANWDYRERRKNEKVINVFPFSSDEKNMTTIVSEEKCCIAYTKGSPEKILALCNLKDEKVKEIENEIIRYQEKAYRIIGFAHRKLEDCHSSKECIALDRLSVENNMEFDGFVAISDPLRSDVYEAVENCRKAGINLKILTGDNIVTATAIAKELNILADNNIAVEAREVECLSDEELSKQLSKISVIARSTPTIKMRVVKLLKDEGNVVAVTGDGINDAPALKHADVGIAMGISGTEVSKEASDIVLLNDSFSTIVNSIEWGRGIYENFKRFISFQLTVNISSVIVVLTSILIGFKVPFTALQLLWINIIMDGPPALTLGLEPVHKDLMKQSPVKRSDNIISKSMLFKIVITGVYISVVFLAQYGFNFLGATYTQMTTVLFALFAMFQLFNSFNCRQLGNESIFNNLTKNRLMLGIISITFILQVLIIQFAGSFFGTVPLPFLMWVKIFAVSSSVIFASELVKLVFRIIKHKK